MDEPGAACTCTCTCLVQAAPGHVRVPLGQLGVSAARARCLLPFFQALAASGRNECACERASDRHGVWRALAAVARRRAKGRGRPSCGEPPPPASTGPPADRERPRETERDRAKPRETESAPLSACHPRRARESILDGRRVPRRPPCCASPRFLRPRRRAEAGTGHARVARAARLSRGRPAGGAWLVHCRLT